MNENGNVFGNILVVDDNADNLKILIKILKQEGFNVNAIKEPLMVFSAVEASTFDLILLDIMMPEMDGFEVCEKLKQNPKSKDIPIIFISALNEIEDKVKAFSKGGVDYITKPFQQAEVIARVKNHLKLVSLQKELKDINRNLEDKIKEEAKKRTLQENLLIQQSKMAEMGEMMGAIAHQWKQPLNTISLSTSTLEFKLNRKYYESMDDGLKNDLTEFIDLLFQKVDFMSKTINDFKNFFKPSTEKEAFDVKESIVQIYEIIKHLFINNHVQIVIDAKEDINIYGRDNEFKQVIMNLLTNAKDAILAQNIPSGKIDIKIDKSDKNVIISISDNGGGIRDELLPTKIFEPYQTTKGSEGTGIGLYMSQKIIKENMAGEIYAQNIENGAKFTIELPLTNP